MKNLLLVITIFGVFGVSFSQSKSALGLRAGVNISNLTNANLETKSDVYLGVYGQFKFSEFYALQPEINYSNQGGKAKNVGDKDVDIHYISISVTNKLFVQNSGFHFIIAPSFDFDADDTLIGIANRNEGNDITFLDMAIGLGFGFEFKNGIGIEARYKRGFIDVFSGSWHDFESNSLYYEENQFNNLYQVGLTYKFDFSKKED
jgi:hypothetical protein